MTDTFSPPIPPQENAEGDNTFNVTDIRFGGGYRALNGEGMNVKEQSWPLRFVGTEAEIVPIRDFLDAHYGYVPFFYTPPLGVQGKFIAKGYRLNAAAAGNYSLSVTLEQVFTP